MTSPPTMIVAYLALFALVGFATIFVALLLGWFLRGKNRTAEKLEIYECGEPPVGSGFAQFDLRFYVIALLFIIFDVEVAFFFPWATVFGKATQLRDPNLQVQTAGVDPEAAFDQKLAELGVPKGGPGGPESAPAKRRDTVVAADQLALAAMIDIGVFFAVLMVGFAYVWHRGDLNWVRALRSAPAERAASAEGS